MFGKKKPLPFKPEIMGSTLSLIATIARGYEQSGYPEKAGELLADLHLGIGELIASRARKLAGSNRWEPFTTTELLALDGAVQSGAAGGSKQTEDVARYLLAQIRVELSEREAEAAERKACVPLDRR